MNFLYNVIGGNIKNFWVSFALVLVCSFIVWIAPTISAADEDITISTNTTWAAGTYECRDITVTNNATLTLGGSYTTDTDGAGVVINARTVTVDSGSAISANGRGYAGGAGTGKGTGSFGSGAGHGGPGSLGGTGEAAGITYDSAVAPLDLGSGGGNAGGAGGGAIKLNLSGNLSLAGSITANAVNGSMWKGGGSGGSIYIIANDLSGAGLITANGGNGASGSGSGGGGRVALYYNGSNSLNLANVTASGGTGGTGPGGIGSRFIFDHANKDLSVSSNMTFGTNIGMDTNGNPTSDGVFNFRNLTVTNNAALTVGSKYTTDSDGSGVEFNLSGNLTVDTGSSITAKGQGYAKNTGEGKGAMNGGGNYGGGGAHGGNGGRAEVGAAGVKYDSTLFPVKLGSGGVTTRGATGGGIIKITAADMTVNGNLDASASNPTADGATNGSGGAGGTVYLTCTSLSGSGTILADASNGTGYSGGGGGGRVAIYGDTSEFNPDNITASKGLKGGSGVSADGEVGTVFLYNTASGNVTASSDVTFYANQGIGRDGIARDDGVFYFNNLTVTNNSNVTIAGNYTNDSDGRGVTINLDGNLTIDSGSTITTNGQGFGAGFGLGKGTGGSNTSGSGGSYGGVGGQSYNGNLAPAVYGSTEANYPFKLGSSGGAGDQVTGPSGGGAITLRVLGNVINNGTISANGSVAKASPIPGWFTGGGSGGSLFLVCDSLSGSGTITAEGGAGGGSTYGSGGGGGGRISVVYTTSQTLPLGNFSAAGGTGGGEVANRNGSEGSVNITQRILPTAEFTLKNPNNNSTEFTNTENVEIVPTDEEVEKYKDAVSASELAPTFYADGWSNVTDGKDVGATEGSKTVRAWFKDSNELISSSVGTATITLDKTDPSVDITNNNQTIQGSTATVALTLDDNISGIDYIVIDGQTIDISVLGKTTMAKASSIKAYAAETTYETTVTLDVGENTIPVVVYDKAGNSTETSFVATRIEAASMDTPTPTATPTVDNPTSTPTSESTQTSTAAANSTTTSEAEAAMSNDSTDITNEESPTATATSTEATELSLLDSDELDKTKPISESDQSRKPAKVYYYIIAFIILGELIYLLSRKKRRV